MDSAPEFTTPTETESGVIKKYLEVETEFMAAAGFFTHSRNALIRSHAVSIIATHSRPTNDPDAYIPYLAMNYFDRYFSRIQFQDVQDVSRDSEKVRLIALCCLFISTKMRTKNFCVDQFLRDKSINFTPKRIMEMELNILKVLHWRMRPVTAFLYLNYYYRFFKSLGGFKRRCINEIIVQAQGESQFVCYKPSLIAMSAFLAAAEIAYPSINKLQYQEEELSECVRALGDLCGRKNIKIKCGKSEAVNSSEEVEDETEPLIRKAQGNGKEVVLALKARTAKGESEESPSDEENLSTKIVVDSSEEEAEDGTEPLIRKTRDKGKEAVLALEDETAQGEAEEPPSGEQIATITDDIGNKTHPEKGSLELDIVEDTKEELEVTEEEKQRLAKGKAVAVFEPSNEQKRRLAKGKEVAVSETSDVERQRLLPRSKSEENMRKLDKREQESVVGVAAIIKLGMGRSKVKKGERVRGSSELEIVNEPERLMNFDLKWVIDVPSLEDGEPQNSLSVQNPPITVQGEGSNNADNKVGCASCSIV